MVVVVVVVGCVIKVGVGWKKLFFIVLVVLLVWGVLFVLMSSLYVVIVI